MLSADWNFSALMDWLNTNFEKFALKNTLKATKLKVYVQKNNMYCVGG